MKKLSEHRRDDIFQTEFNFFCAHSKFFYAIKKFLHAIKFCLRLIKTFLRGSIFSLLINAAAGIAVVLPQATALEGSQKFQSCFNAVCKPIQVKQIVKTFFGQNAGNDSTIKRWPGGKS